MQILDRNLYSGIPLIRSPMGHKNMAVLTGWPYYPGQGQIQRLTPGGIAHAPYIAFALLEQLFTLMNYRNGDIAYCNCKNYSQLPITQTVKGNRTKVRVIGSSKKIAGSKERNSCYCIVNILITFNCRNVK